MGGQLRNKTTPLPRENPKMASRAQIARMHLDRARRYADARTWTAGKEAAHYRKAVTALRFGAAPKPQIAQTLRNAEEKLELLAKGQIPRTLQGAKPEDPEMLAIYFRDSVLREIHATCADEARRAVASMSFVAADFPELAHFLEVVVRQLTSGASFDADELKRACAAIEKLKPLFATLPRNMELLIRQLTVLVEKDPRNTKLLLSYLVL